MANLQAIFAGFYQTDVEIYALTSSSSTYSDDQESFPSTPTAVVKGWMRNQPDYAVTDDSGATQHPEIARLFLPIGTQVSRGDKVVIDGHPWTVVDDNEENTYKVTLRVAVRRMD